VPYIDDLVEVEVGKHIDRMLNERFLIILSTKENVNLQTLGFSVESSEGFHAIITPIDIAGERLGTLFMYKKDHPYEIDDIAQIDEYDNSIRFTDLLLGKILAKLNDLQYPAFFLYVSDHGECPEKIHRSPRAGSSALPEVYEIPFVLYANPKYREKYPFFMTSAAANQHKSYQTDWVMYAFFSAARITFEQFPYEKDIFSDKFVPPKKRFLGSSNVEYHLRKSPFQTMQKTAVDK
ncbi:MAG: sulfatase-like hydrolase/transferase, partial [Victivallales bacterium]